MSFASSFSHSTGCLFILLMASFAVQKLLLISLIRSHLFIFAIVSFTLGDRASKKKHWYTDVKECSAYVYFYEFYGFRSCIWSLTNFEFIFIYDVRKCSNFTLLHVAIQFPQHLYWRDCLFPVVYACLHYYRLIDHTCVGLLLVSLICSASLCVNFLCQYCFDYCSLVV